MNQAADFSDYKPIPKLSDFPTHPARFKWIYGGVGARKTTSLCYQALLLSTWFPGNYGVLGRRVEKFLRKTLVKKTIELCRKYDLVSNWSKDWEKTSMLLTLRNRSQIQFYPMNLPVTEYGSEEVGFVMFDEASEIKELIIKYWVTRLRKTETIFGESIKREMVLCSTWEGHNYLWRLWLRDQRDNPMFKAWKVRTRDNPYLPDDYEDMLRMVHSEDWCKRYLNCEEDSFSGLVYPEFDMDFHLVDDFLENFDIKNAKKILAIDTGMTHPTGLVVLIYDKEGNTIYCVDVFKKSGIGVETLARQIDIFMDRYGIKRNEVIIDSKAQSKEQTSKTSVRQELRKYLGFLIRYANKNKTVGIEKVKNRLTIKTDEDGGEYAGLYFFKGRTKPLVDELLEYIWVDATLEEFDQIVKEEPKKQRDDLMDCLRYGIMELDNIAFREQRYIDSPFDPRLKLPYYRDLIKKYGLESRIPIEYFEELTLDKQTKM